MRKEKSERGDKGERRMVREERGEWLERREGRSERGEVREGGERCERRIMSTDLGDR